MIARGMCKKKRDSACYLDVVKPISTYWGADIEILRHYLENSLGGYVGVEYSEPQGRIIFK